MADKEYTVGRFSLLMPEDHKLDLYQRQFGLYDRALAEIARAVAGKYPGAPVIDIGANIGDSAALICRYQDLPVLCIEGNPTFLAYLRRNLAHLPGCVEIAETLIGSALGAIAAGTMHTGDGTARIDIDTATHAEDGIPIEPLGSLLHRHPRYSSARLMKCDTDGNDFDIILSSKDLLASLLPVLFFEFDPTIRKSGIRQGIAAISALEEIGYRRFLVYDNFGNMMRPVEGNAAQEFKDLSRYLLSHVFTGRQIFYLDVCAFTAADMDLADTIYTDHCRVVGKTIRANGWEF